MKWNRIKVLTMARRSDALLQGTTMNVSALIIFVLIVPLVYSLADEPTDSGNGCTVSINYLDGDLHEPQPLLVDDANGKASFLNPINKKGTIQLRAGQPVIIACPGKGNYIEGINGLKNVNEMEAKCLSGKTFTSVSSSFDFSRLACKSLPAHVARRTRARCYQDASKIEIGFQLKKEFLKTIEVCRDDETMMTLWSKFTLTPAIAGYQASFPRPSKWEIGDFFPNYNIDKQYQAYTQKGTLTKLLNSQELANKYIDVPTKRYMARGHLTAKADFVYGTAQLSTFWYLNAAPQWQTFNAGNWNTLESSVRKFAAQRTSDLEVYTGTFGQMNLADGRGRSVPIFLHVDQNGKNFPVPKFFWKIIYDRRTKKGTAFVGCNDPWADKIRKDMFICTNIIEKISWLNWQPKDIVKGVSYACDVDDFRKSVPYVPVFPVNGILV